MLKFDLKKIFVVLILLAASFLTYSNSLHNQFLMDDQGLLIENSRFHNLKFLYQPFIPDSKKYLQIEHTSSDVYYRPLQDATLMIFFHWFRNNVFYYHLINLILFLFCGFSIYVLVATLFRRHALALIASLLYITHPINGLFVNYITANIFAIQITLMIWAIIIAFKADEGRNQVRDYAVSALLFILSILCHETSLAFPFYMFSIFYFLKKLDIKQSCLRCLGYVGIMLLYLGLRLKFASLQGSLLTKILQFDVTLFEYLASLTKLIGWYFVKFFSLQGIVMTWATAPVRDHVFLWNGIFFSLLIGFFAILRNWRRYPVVAWSLAWIGIGFIPVSLGCFFDPKSGFYIEPHWLFFPSIGLFVLCADSLLNLKRFIRPCLFFVVLGSIFLILMMSSKTYNRLWSNEKTYAHYWHSQSPSIKSILFYLGDAHFREGEFQQARIYFSQALEGRFPDWQIYSNLGLMDYKEGHFDRAMDYYSKALTFFPASGIVHNNLGLAYLKKGDQKAAEESFARAIEYNRFLLEPKLNLAKIYKQRGETDKALQLYQENLRIDPLDGRSNLELLSIYLDRPDVSEALRLGKDILNHIHDPGLLTDAGSLFAQKKMVAPAFDFYARALKQDPKDKKIYFELGKLFGNLNNFDRAIEVWRAGQKIDPGDSAFQELINQALILKARND